LNKLRCFAIIGGDLRQVKMANSLVADGHIVKCYGFTEGLDFSEGIILCISLQDAVENADTIILPLPCSLDDITVNAPFASSPISLDEVYRLINKNQILVGGKISEKILSQAKIFNIYCIDYFDREELTVLNAIPTAEGAIQIAMEETAITLHGSSCLVLGFGRIGKVLSKMLHGLGAMVTVEARKYADLALIKSMGYAGVHLNKLNTLIGEFDIIINTVPFKILDGELLKQVNKECLLIDLASKPGGIELNTARELGLKAIWALSLPGKVAPITAGNIIKDTIYNILEDLGV